MTRPNTYRATQADWDLQKTWSDDCQDARCLLELRARLEALEAGTWYPPELGTGGFLLNNPPFAPMTDGPASFNYPDPSPDRTHTNPFTGKPVAPMTNTTPTTPHRATPDQWADIEQWGGTLTACLLELRSRLEALEAGATCPHIISGDEGTSYCGLAEQQAGIGQSDVPVDTSAQPAPAGSLVEAVMEAMKRAECSWPAEARAAIRAVAEWLRGHHADGDPVAATALEREARR